MTENNELPTHCPECKAEMIDDVWEQITEQENGSFLIETIVPALICSKFCGYYVRLEE